MNIFPLLFLLLTALFVPAHAAPEVWISPPGSDHGKSLRALFQHPDQWRQARSRVDVLFSTDLQFNKFYSDDDLRAWFAQMKRWHLTLALEVGAVKEWGVTGAGTFAPERPIWDRIRRLGGDISAVAMDEPLSCVRQLLHKPDDYAVQETANYIALVRQYDPTIKVGDIEPYPSISLADHQAWITALQAELARRHVRGLDFYRVDPDWVNFAAAGRGSWGEVKQLEQGCRAQGLPFGLIYWAADYPEMQIAGKADDSTWYVSTIQQGYDYALAGGAPDQYVIESWVGAPAHCVPESADFTFTRSVRDFVQKFVPARGPASGASP